LHFFALYQEFITPQGVFQVFFNEIKGLGHCLHENMPEKILEN
jgi:hypothetical protein